LVLTFTITSVLGAGVLVVAIHSVLVLGIAVGGIAVFITVGFVTMFLGSLLFVERPSPALLPELSP
jgi:hypothetical protein